MWAVLQLRGEASGWHSSQSWRGLYAREAQPVKPKPGLRRVKFRKRQEIVTDVRVRVPRPRFVQSRRRRLPPVGSSIRSFRY